MSRRRMGRRRASRRRRGRWTPYLLVGPGLIWLVVFFLVPTGTLVSQSLQTGSLTTGYALTWNVGVYRDVLGAYWPHLVRSLLYAGVATAAALVIAYPLAYTIAFRTGRWRGPLLVVVVAPFLTSFLVRLAAWKTVLADSGPVAEALGALGLLWGTDGRLLATPVAVVCGLTYQALPFVILPLYASLERIDRRVLEAARDLYASPFTAFRTVTLPLSTPGMVGGALLAFIPAAGDYLNADLLGTPRTAMAGNVVRNKFLVSLDYPGAAALSVVLMVAILVTLGAPLGVAYLRRARARGPVR